MSVCEGSYRHAGISPGQMRHTAGAVRANQATDVRCPVCQREFATTRISYSDHGIPTSGRALIPRHRASA